MDSDVRVRPVERGDRESWRELYAGYRAFYAMAPDDRVLDRVWGWLFDGAHVLDGLVAEVDGTVVGLAHHRPFCRPSRGGEALYLDDLFTSPAARGRGVARALLDRLAGLGRDRGCDVVRWITAEDNHAAQSVYDSVATRTSWVTYDRVL